METTLVVLLVVYALFGASAVNPCLDSTDEATYRCEELIEDGHLSLDSCDLTDEDVEGGDLASCLDSAGREFISVLALYDNALTTLPAGIFEGLTALVTLFLYGNVLTTLPAGIFDGLTSLVALSMHRNAITALPAGIFEDLTALEYLFLYQNALTTLPAGIFESSTALSQLALYDNALTTLPAGLFESPTDLGYLALQNNTLTSLPAGIFENLTSLWSLNLKGNNLECLPAMPSTLAEADDDDTPVPDGWCADPYGDECGCSVPDVTDNLCGEGICAPGPVGYTCATAVPSPAPVSAATPTPVAATPAPAAATPAPAAATPAPAAASPAPVAATPVPVAATPVPAAATPAPVAATPAPVAASPAPVAATPVPVAATPVPAAATPAPAAGTPALVAASPAPVAATPVPEGSGETEDCIDGIEGSADNGVVVCCKVSCNTCSDDDGCDEDENAADCCPLAIATSGDFCEDGEPPCIASSATPPAPSPVPFGITSTTNPVTTPPEQKSASDSMPVVAGVVSAVAGAALVALAVFLNRRRGSDQRVTRPPAVPPAHDDGNAEQGREEPPDLRPPPYSVAVAVGSGDKPPSHQDNVSLRRQTPAGANAVDGDGLAPPSAPSSLNGQVRPSAEHAENPAEGCFARLASEDAAGCSAEKLPAATNASTTTTSTGNLSTAERGELSQFHQRGRVADAAPVSGGPKPGKASGGGPGAFSAADHHNSADIGLGRAVLAAAQELARHCQIPGVSEAATAVCMMANLVKDSRENAKASESRLRQCSTIIVALKRAAKVADKGGDTIGEVARGMIEDVHGAIFDLVQLIKTYQSKNKLSRLFMSTLFKRRQEELDAVVDQAIMRLQLGLQLQVGQDVGAVKDKVDSVQEGMDFYRLSLAEAASESVAEARRIKRRRTLDQLEIPAENLTITDELLGRGGFGEVYLADYNGHNAAAKVLRVAQTGALDENQKQREASQHRAFLRELEAMIRLRSLNTVNVYGAVTCLPDRMVLVMELLAGGDLLMFLKKSKEPLPEDHARRIIREICTGMAFLHSKDTVHGDLKSANVLLDSSGRAKIADFGTSRWTQTTNSTGLATYTTKSSRNTQMSIAWSAPEVLESEGSSYESDVYSFGIVAWEVISRELPWAKKTRPRDILTAVWRGDRPSFHLDAPADIVDIAKACWCGEPKERATFRAILEGMKAKGWGDE
ncbi:unnamed protein product [Ectocarpus sp. 13 AM-2016]